MKKRGVIAIILLAGLFLLGCSERTPVIEFEEYDEINNYLNLNEYMNKIDSERINLIESSFVSENKAQNIMSVMYYFEETLLHLYGTPNLCWMLETGRIRVDCDVIGCSHEDEEVCPAYENVANETLIIKLAYKDTTYYVKNSVLYSEKNGEVTEIFKNEYVPVIEVGSDYIPTSDMSVFVIEGNYLYLTGYTFLYRYNLSTGEMSKVQDTGVKGWLSGDASGDLFFIVNQENELFRYDFCTGETKKIADRVSYINCIDGVVYYCGFISGGHALYSMNTDGENVKKILDDCYVNFYIAGDNIYYQSYGSKKCYSSDLDGKNITELAIDTSEICYILSADNLNSVIYYTGVDSAYIVNKESKEVKEKIFFENEQQE